MIRAMTPNNLTTNERPTLEGHELLATSASPGRSVLITGGAGSLGKAFARLLWRDHRVICIDNNEWACAQLRSELPGVIVQLDDYANWDADDLPADYVIHCAAYKHVDLGETNVPAFVQQNVTNAATLFAKANRSDARLLFVSTDKAVEPVSSYGFTKALGERLCWHYGGAVARLGNILNSTGSVIPVWEAQIAKGSPITVTDPFMTRYLIEDHDAVGQIWRQFMDGLPLCVPVMPPPVPLMQLLADVLGRHGYDSIEEYAPGILETGMRPGEKLHEKLCWDDELTALPWVKSP